MTFSLPSLLSLLKLPTKPASVHNEDISYQQIDELPYSLQWKTETGLKCNSWAEGRNSKTNRLAPALSRIAAHHAVVHGTSDVYICA